MKEKSCQDKDLLFSQLQGAQAEVSQQLQVSRERTTRAESSMQKLTETLKETERELVGKDAEIHLIEAELKTAQEESEQAKEQVSALQAQLDTEKIKEENFPTLADLQKNLKNARDELASCFETLSDEQTTPAHHGEKAKEVIPHPPSDPPPNKVSQSHLDVSGTSTQASDQSHSDISNTADQSNLDTSTDADHHSSAVSSSDVELESSTHSEPKQVTEEMGHEIEKGASSHPAAEQVEEPLSSIEEAAPHENMTVEDAQETDIHERNGHEDDL
eukprot:CAMPEP_0196581644 /NCGR_PEP_ID=MMETSP1081-20130531/34767_1 /TAXON_ID=36882 /ORGANISM="Pyramimonas amylifera, Strain CCMP720" /LENGTH=273 /DNA_ID=CAMNT_0041901955 /DNA_START=455 /DNA_END=1276 /DNA_ORIENTATION=+